MISFKILKTSKRSRARLGILKTPHGEVETPAFVPVATLGSVKTLTSEAAAATGSQLLIANTYHLHLRPGERIVKRAGGLHTFMNWRRPLLTDSGGFQVFSLGFGFDHGVGKILKSARQRLIQAGRQPKKLKITDDGVYFRSVLDGQQLFLGPQESIRIQEALGADIMFAFDECTSPLADYEYVKSSLARTHRWAALSLSTRRTRQALFGITQGSHFRDLREASARAINALGFDGFGIGGDFGSDRGATDKVLDWTLPLLDPKKPRHFLGIGYLADLVRIIALGVDTFDCTVPTHYGRRGVAFTSRGRLNLRQSKFLTDKEPLDKQCSCEICARYRRNYIAHLVRAGELTALALLTFHNLYFWHARVAELRQLIKRDRL